jgi:hypothetical protein
MEKGQVLVRKNKYWLSEIAEIFFNYQINYTVFSYSDENVVGDNVDLLVLNKQLIPYYVLAMGNPEPHNTFFFPFIENDEESRLLTSECDYVFFYDINSDYVHVADLPLLQETIDYQYTKGNWKDFPSVRKQVASTGIQVPKEDEALKFINSYKLNQELAEKAKRIYNFRVSQIPLSRTKVLPISRVEGYDSLTS